MFEFIKTGLEEKMAKNNPPQQEVVTESKNDNEISDETILEYSSMFNELDGLSVEGTEAGKVRKMSIDIPIEDDLDVDTIEISLKDNRVVDVPMDATIQETYKHVKTFDDFVTEVENKTLKFTRESDSAYKDRVHMEAAKLFDAYQEDLRARGLYGNEKICVTESCVPNIIKVNLGQITSKLPVKYQMDKNNNIVRRQLDSVNTIRNGAFSNIENELSVQMESAGIMTKGENVWDYITPVGIFIAEGDPTSFNAVLEYAVDSTGEKKYMAWSRLAKTPDHEVVEESSIDTVANNNIQMFVESSFASKVSAVNEIEHKKAHKPSRLISREIFQEAIDFGGDDSSSSSDDGGDPPAIDGDDSASTDDTSSDGTNTDSNNDTETAAVNDVSDQIVEKVAEKTKQQAEEQNGVDSSMDDFDSNVTFDDGSTNDVGDDTSVDDGMDDSSDELGDLSDTSMSFGPSDEGGMDEEDDSEGFDDNLEDLDNLTINDLVERGSEKLKGMTLSEIKSFIQTATPGEIQEAFILTKGNINKEMDIKIRNCLGILNNNELTLKQIIMKFKFEGKKLNRVLTKAAKMNDVYSNNEVIEITKLNKALTDLTVNLKLANQSDNTSIVKTQIKAFVSQTKVVGNIIESKLKAEKDVDKSMKKEKKIKEGETNAE